MLVQFVTLHVHVESYVVRGLLMQGVAMRHRATRYMHGDLVDADTVCAKTA